MDGFDKLDVRDMIKEAVAELSSGQTKEVENLIKAAIQSERERIAREIKYQASHGYYSSGVDHEVREMLLAIAERIKSDD